MQRVCKICGRTFEGFPYQNFCSWRCRYYYDLLKEGNNIKASWQRLLEDRILRDFLNSKSGYWVLDRLNGYYNAFIKVWSEDLPVKWRFTNSEKIRIMRNESRQKRQIEVFRRKVVRGVFQFLKLDKFDEALAKEVLLRFARVVYKDEEKAKLVVEDFFVKV